MCFVLGEIFFRFRDGNATLIIFKDFTKDLVLLKMNIKDKWYLLHHNHKRYYAAHLNWSSPRRPLFLDALTSSYSSSSGPASVTLYHAHYWVVIFHPRTAATGQ